MLQQFIFSPMKKSSAQARVFFFFCALNSKVKNNISSLVVTAGSKLSLIRLEAMTIFVTQIWPLMQTFELLLAWVGKWLMACYINIKQKMLYFKTLFFGGWGSFYRPIDKLLKRYPYDTSLYGCFFWKPGYAWQIPQHKIYLHIY